MERRGQGDRGRRIPGLSRNRWRESALHHPHRPGRTLHDQTHRSETQPARRRRDFREAWEVVWSAGICQLVVGILPAASLEWSNLRLYIHQTVKEALTTSA